MWGTSIFKCIGIVSEPLTGRIKRWVILAHVLTKLRVRVNPLGTGHDFLASHEKVKRIGDERVIGVRGGIKGTSGPRKFVHGEKVGRILFEDEAAQGFFLGGADGLISRDVRIKPRIGIQKI